MNSRVCARIADDIRSLPLRVERVRFLVFQSLPLMSRVTRQFISFLIIAVIFVGDSAMAQFDRPVPGPPQSRSVVMAQRGVVATSQPLAVQVGIDILKAGGTAADAAIAVNAVLGVVEPHNCGIGGDLFAIYWDAKTKKLYGLNGSGRMPYAINREIFQQKELKEIPGTGPLSWSVPGCVDAWDQLRQRFGKRPMADLLAPAIDYAEHGFPVSEIVAEGWSGGEDVLAKDEGSAAIWLRDGKSPTAGTIFKNPQLASAYRKIGVQGPAAFYTKDIAAALVKTSERVGGLITARDLADHKSDWIEPVSTNYRGYDVWELPPNGQGICALQMLNILE